MPDGYSSQFDWTSKRTPGHSLSFWRTPAGVRVGMGIRPNTVLSVHLPEAPAAELRDWLIAQDLGDPRRARLEALRDAIEALEREYGPVDRDMLDEVHRTWPDVAYGGEVCCAQHEDHERARVPRSLGMGNNGPADLSEREGFGAVQEGE